MDGLLARVSIEAKSAEDGEDGEETAKTPNGHIHTTRGLLRSYALFSLGHYKWWWRRDKEIKNNKCNRVVVAQDWYKSKHLFKALVLPLKKSLPLNSESDLILRSLFVEVKQDQFYSLFVAVVERGAGDQITFIYLSLAHQHLADQNRDLRIDSKWMQSQINGDKLLWHCPVPAGIKCWYDRWCIDRISQMILEVHENRHHQRSAKWLQRYKEYSIFDIHEFMVMKWGIGCWKIFKHLHLSFCNDWERSNNRICCSPPSRCPSGIV